MLNLATMTINELDILYRVYGSICERLKIELDELSANVKSPEYIEKKETLAIRSAEYEIIHAYIGKCQKEKLLFSIEDIYFFSGQEDKYSIFHFYPTSEAFKKYGETVYGWLLYQKKEREALEQKIKNPPYEKTDGKVMLDGAVKDDAINQLLKTDGFLASEVMKFHNMNHHDNRVKQYGKAGRKEIPNTINLKFDASRMDIYGMELYITGGKIKDGYVIPLHDLISYYSVLSVLRPADITDEIRYTYLFQDDKKTLNEQAEFKILEIKYHKRLITQKEQKRLGELIAQRRLERFKVVEKQLGVPMKRIVEFGESYPDQFVEMSNAVMHFRTDTLTNYKTAYPVYLDFERFVHIYIKHYDRFWVPGSTLNGTPFQYNYKDVRRLMVLIIEELKDEIEESLSKGKEYRKYGDQGYYFNGNYYTLRVGADGRLLQFHAQETAKTT